MTSPEVFTSNLEEAEELSQLLSEAISCGDKKEAKRCSEQLAELCVPVSVRISHNAYSQHSIRLKVGVGDAQSENYVPVTLLVTLNMTISDLKEKINTDYGFHPSLQSWVIGKRLARDSNTLYSHGVRKNGDQAYLYIKSAQAANLSREQVNQEEEHRRLDSIIESLSPLLARGATGPTPPPKTKHPASPPPPPKLQVGWSCSVCTYANKPTRPGCEMCGSERPEDYKVPEVYQPDEQEVQRLQLEEMANLQYQQEGIGGRAGEEFPESGGNRRPQPRPQHRGAGLECLKGTIVNSMDPEVACPYGDEDYSCDRKLQDREIKSEEHQKFLELRLSIAETRSENSYHCKTPDCAGWCIFEDEVNEFICELCKETNCLLCKAIHKDMNCKEYQDDLRIRAENDVAAKQTTQMLESLLQNGEAMHCPKCKVIVQKKDGCDWICCLMCKTEICWRRITTYI
ncbi:unnamed protein product, partial [Coregonus sp. 'balchen']